MSSRHHLLTLIKTKTDNGRSACEVFPVGCGRCAQCRAGDAIRCEFGAANCYGLSHALEGCQTEAVMVPHADSNAARLIVAVIKQAFVDLCSPSKHQRAEARRFFQDGRLKLWCDQVGLSPNFMREIAIKAGYRNPADASEGGGHA